MAEQAKHTCRRFADGTDTLNCRAEISRIDDHGHKQEELWAYHHPGVQRDF